MRASIGTHLAWAALASVTLFACNERQRDPGDPSSMAAGAPAIRAVSEVSAASPGGLAGRSFIVEARNPQGGAPQVDTITFADGQFRSSFGSQSGYGPATYNVVRDNVGEAFTASSGDTKSGSIEWSGMLVKGRLDGKAVWSRPGQQPVEYEFRGYAE
jgi:hypothetical protein